MMILYQNNDDDDNDVLICILITDGTDIECNLPTSNTDRIIVVNLISPHPQTSPQRLQQIIL